MRCTLLAAFAFVCLLVPEMLRGNDSSHPIDIGEQVEGDGKLTLLNTEPGRVNAILNTSAKGELYLRCDRLRIHRPSMNRERRLQLEGIGNVEIRGSKWQAQATRVTYDEEKDRLIFIGSEKAPASLTRFPEGHMVEIIRGMKIIYCRETGRLEMSN